MCLSKKTRPIPRLLNERTGNSHYHWTKKWGAGQRIPGCGDLFPLLDHRDVVAEATTDQASDRLDPRRLDLPAVSRRLRSEGVRVGHHRLGLEKDRQLGLQGLRLSRKSPLARDCPRGPGPCQTSANRCRLASRSANPGVESFFLRNISRRPPGREAARARLGEQG